MKSITFSIRKATLDDANAICKVHKASVRALVAADYTVMQIETWIGKRMPEGYARAMETGEEIMFIAVIPDDPHRTAGFASLCLESAGNERSAEIRAVYIAPEFARCGVGRALLASLEAEALAAGVQMLNLDSSTTAVPFYESQGYLQVERSSRKLSNNVFLECVRMNKRIGVQMR